MKQKIIDLLKKPELKMKWQQFNSAIRYGQVEIECYDKNNKRYSATLFFGTQDVVYLINTGYSIGVGINGESFIYGDVLKFTNFDNYQKCEVCFSEVNCNE